MKKIIVILVAVLAALFVANTVSSASAEETPNVTFSNATFCDGVVTLAVTATGLYPDTGYSIEDSTGTWGSYGVGGTSPDSDSGGNFTGSVKLIGSGAAPTTLSFKMYLDDSSSAYPYWESEFVAVSVANCDIPPPTETTTTTVVTPPPTETTTTTVVTPPPTETIAPTVATLPLTETIAPTVVTPPPTAIKSPAKKEKIPADLLTTS